MDTQQDRPSVTEAHERMLKVWRHIFEEQSVGPDSDFFVDLEGDSRAAVAIAHWTSIEFGVQVPMIEVFDHPTPAALTEVVLGLLG